MKQVFPNGCCLRDYWPVAVTLQVTLNVTVELALNVGVICKPVLCKAATVGEAGQVAVPALTAQVTEVQLKPADGGSVSVAPGAAVGPRLATVMV